MDITEDLLNSIWKCAKTVEGYDPALIRKDPCGAWIRRDKYGDRSNAFGWELDHIFPKSKLEEKNIPENEINNMENLRAMQWMNNSTKADDYPMYHASVVAVENKNIEQSRVFSVGKTRQVVLKSLFGKYFV